MVETENYLLYNKELKIIQRKDMFNYSLDSVLLAHFAFISKAAKTIIDFGTNNAAIPLILSKLTSTKIIGVEIQKEAVELAHKNIKLNNLEEQITIVNDDIKNFVNEYPDKVDLVLCNPPFFKKGERSNVNENEFLRIARHEEKITLEEIICCASKILNNNGRFSMIHRPERLIEIIDIMKYYKIEPKRLQLVYPKQNKECNMILIEGRYQGNIGLKIEPFIIAHNDDGSYTKDIEKMFLQEDSD
jgi:tRNA1(Val) A37 N6-methylase TrmN6